MEWEFALVFSQERDCFRCAARLRARVSETALQRAKRHRAASPLRTHGHGRPARRTRTLSFMFVCPQLPTRGMAPRLPDWRFGRRGVAPCYSFWHFRKHTAVPTVAVSPRGGTYDTAAFLVAAGRMLLLSLLDDPLLRVGIVAVTNVVPVIALCHLVFIHGISFLGVALSVVMTIINSGTCMTVLLHRYFSHRAFEVGRLTQFVLAWISCLAYQQGPLWWASKHRRHHSTCDTADDPHSWSRTSFYYAWVGWTMDPKEGHIDVDYLGSLASYHELWAVDRLWFVPPFALVRALWLWGIHPAYPLCSMLACRLITLHFNCVFHPAPGEELSELVPDGKKCRAIDLMRGSVDFMADAVGESHHDDHHVHPTRAKRPGRDYSFRFFVAPLVALGLAWSPKAMAQDTPSPPHKRPPSPRHIAAEHVKSS